MQHKLIAEGIGTFALVLVVQLSLVSESSIATPVLAALVLGLFVYTIGSRSGCHINPAVTLGLWSINKIKTRESVQYIISQLIGAGLATLFMVALEGAPIYFTLAPDSWITLLGEAVGSILFGFGIAAVVFGKVREDMSGVVIGGSLLVGLFIAASIGSTGVLNPAVALSLGAVDLSHVLGSIIGVTLGMNLYRKFIA